MGSFAPSACGREKPKLASVYLIELSRRNS